MERKRVQRMQKTRTWQVPLLATTLAVVILIGVLSYKQVTPFGDHNFLISDMGTQYIPLFTAYQRALTHGIHLYSLSQSIGGNIVATWAYYLMSPFNLLLIAFTPATIPTGVTVILIAKVGAIAGTMTVYLMQHFTTRRWSTALFGLAFSLCGFVAMNYFDLMWLDALVWLPLVLTGLDRLLAGKSATGFFCWLWVSIVTNFYLGYMVCLFVICYFVAQFLATNDPRATLRDNLHTRRTLIWRTLLTGTLSVISTLFLLIPTALDMLQTAKTSSHATNFSLAPQYNLSILSQLGVGASNYTNRLSHAPTLFASTVVVLLAMAYFVHPRISRTAKLRNGVFLGVLLLSMGVRLLDTVWHLFQQPAGFPFRDAFFTSFLLITLAFRTWLADPHALAPRWRWGLPALLMSAILLGFGLGQRPHDPLAQTVLGGQPLAARTVLLQVGFILVSAGLLFWTRHQLRTLTVAVVMAGELGTNFVLSMHATTFGSQSAYATRYQTESQQLGSLSNQTTSLARVITTSSLIDQSYREVYNNYNDATLFNLQGIGTYSSTLNEQTRQSLADLGFFSSNVRRISSEGLSPVSALLLGVRTTVGFTAQDQATMALNPEYVGLGFAMPSRLFQVTPTSNALTYQERILQALAPSAHTYFANASVVHQTVTRDPQATTYHDVHHLTLRVTATGPLYYDDPTGATKYATIKVNSATIAPPVNANGSPLLWSLGTFHKGDRVTLQVKNRHATLSPVHLASLDLARFQTVAQALQASAFTPTQHTHFGLPVITGTVANQENRRWLYVALPYEHSWRITVNGRAVTTRPVLHGLTAIPLQAGANHLTLRYQIPGLALGLGLSALGLGMAGGLWLVTRRKKAARPRHSITHS